MTNYVTYTVGADDRDVFEVRFEFEPTPGSPDAAQVGSTQLARRMFRSALRPLVAAAGEVTDELRSLEADQVELRFGLKAAAEAGGWLVAKATTEANFEVIVTWRQAGSAAVPVASHPEEAPSATPSVP